ncbi:uncharacterized protein LOC144147077 [Haemaphysalis longicornis]
MDSSNKPLLPVTSNGNAALQSMLGLNYRYCFSLIGVLKLIEMGLNVMCIQMMLEYCNPAYSGASWGFLGTTDETLFILGNFSALMMNGLLFLCCVLSGATAVALSKSLLDVMGNLAHFLICIGSSLVLLSSGVNHQPGSRYREQVFQGKVTVSALSSISLCLILWYGTPVWLLLGPAYPFYLTAVTCSLMGSATFLLAYLVSRNTFLVTRTTVLETIQNGVSFLLLAGSSSFLLVQTSFFLWPMYLLIPFFQAYPAMMAAGVLGATAAAVHFMDSILACRNIRQ